MQKLAYLLDLVTWPHVVGGLSCIRNCLSELKFRRMDDIDHTVQLYFTWSQGRYLSIVITLVEYC